LESGLWPGLLALYKNSTMYDYTIIVGPQRQKFFSHKVLLYARSEFFRRLFDNMN
jgi:L-rhamnose mutarotase